MVEGQDRQIRQLHFFIISWTRVGYTEQSLQTRVSCAQACLLFVRFVGQQLLVTLQTGGCTGVFVPPAQGHGKSESVSW